VTPRLAALALLAAALACSDTLVDGNAPPHLVNTCDPGQAVCGGACVAEDATHCGPTCADCSGTPVSDPHGVPACAAGTCGFACADGYLRSAGGCARAAQVVAGFAHTCALLEGGDVRCWGANDHGQLGEGTRVDSAAPVAVALPGPATAVVAGYIHSCAVVAGAVYCWGDNSTGELGDGTTTARSTPVHVAGVDGATALAAGGGENVTGSGTYAGTYYGHTCALLGGAVSCWGGNESGQLGDGTFTPHPHPAPVQGLGAGVSAVAAGDRFTCALAGGAVQCWGANTFGQLGSGGTANAATPQVTIAGGAGAVAAGNQHACAITGAAGAEALSCWGDNGSGEVAGGVNAPGQQATPLAVSLPFHPTVLAAGGAHTCAAAAGVPNGTICFGSNGGSQLGAPATPRGSNPPALGAVTTLAAGFAHSCAVTADGLRCWGLNDRGQLGIGPGAAPVVAAPTLVSGQ
jgi:alpha-tubulin suppressor-like RCC1 family protein